MTLLSYVHGASDKPLLGTTIGQAFDQATEQYADELALCRASKVFAIPIVNYETRSIALRAVCVA